MTKNIQVLLKKVFTEEQVKEFLKKLKVPDYSIFNNGRRPLHKFHCCLRENGQGASLNQIRSF